MPPEPSGLDPHRNLRHKADVWFVVSLILIPCCCFLGTAGAVLSYQAKDLIAQQRLEEAESKLSAAKLITLTGIGVVVFLFVIQLLLFIVSAVLGRPLHFQI